MSNDYDEVVGQLKVEDKEWTFDYQGKRYIPSWEDAKASGTGTFLESESPIYINLLASPFSSSKGFSYNTTAPSLFSSEV